MHAPQKQEASLSRRSAAYVAFVERWLDERPEAHLNDLIQRAGGPERVAVLSVDLIVGFCHSGPLASSRVAGVLPAVRRLLSRANAVGITTMVFAQDTHRPDAEEFGSYPPHCVAGTEESRMADELASLPFASSFTVVEKNSISSLIAPRFTEWEASRGPFQTWIIVGDCTDLCVYQAAMALKLRSVEASLGQRVVVPVDCVETYDVPVETAERTGAPPHDGDLLHHVFLHSMAQNGVEVVARIV